MSNRTASDYPCMVAGSSSPGSQAGLARILIRNSLLLMRYRPQPRPELLEMCSWSVEVEAWDDVGGSLASAPAEAHPHVFVGPWFPQLTRSICTLEFAS